MSLPVSPSDAAKELLRRRGARAGLIGFSRAIEIPGRPVEGDEDREGFASPAAIETPVAAHHRLLMGAFERCVDAPRGRLMVFMPPGSAKSTYASVVGPVWAMARRPGFKVIAASYGSDLQRKLGRRCRSIVRQPGFASLFGAGLSRESAAADEWALTNGSEYMGGGILSGITGNRADLVVIDDPVRGREQAESPAIRKKTVEAYEDDLKTRLVPGGSLVLIQTRWHEADLAGSILPEGYAGESGAIMCRDGQVWEVICLQAKAERDDDPLGRAPGEYLWPEWFDAGHWRQFETVPRTWASLYQQRPAPDAGDVFRRDWLRFYDALPEGCRPYGGSDYAVSVDGDFTVHVVAFYDRDGNLYVHDLWRGRGEPDVWVEALLDLVERHDPLGWAEEAGQINKSVGPYLRTRMRERKVFFAREQIASTEDKVARARSLQGRMASGKVYLRAGRPWLADLVSELMVFPNGRHDDQVDALTKLVQLLDRMRGRAEPSCRDETRNPHLAKNAFAQRPKKERL